MVIVSDGEPRRTDPKMQVWLPPPPNFVGNASYGIAPRNSSLLLHPPYVPNQSRPPRPDLPGRDDVLYRQSLAAVDPRPTKSSYKPRREYWAPKRETYNQAPSELKNPVQKAQEYEHRRAAAKRRDWQGLNPAKTGRDANGNIAGGLVDQYVDRKPYGLDAELAKPSRRYIWDRYESAIHRAREPELLTMTPIPVLGPTMRGALNAFEHTQGQKDDYVRNQRDGAASKPATATLASAQIGVAYSGRINEKQRDHTSMGISAIPQPMRYGGEEPLRSASGWGDRRSRGVENLSPLPSQINAPFKEAANRSSDTLDQATENIKSSRESTSYRPSGTAKVPWAPSNLARSLQHENRQGDKQQANNRFADIQVISSYVPRQTNRQTLMPVTERRLPVESLTRDELFRLDPTDPNTIDVMTRRNNYAGGVHVFSQRGRALADLQARVMEKNSLLGGAVKFQ